MLAPMEKIVDSCFRTISHRYGADLTFTELIRFETLAKRNKSALKRIVLYDETPSMIQLMGKDERLLEVFLNNFEPSHGFKGFDLNLGCPSQHYVRSGVGVAMVKRPTKTKRIVDIIKDHGYSVSVKLRLGMNKQEKVDKIYLKLIEKVDADFFTVHARYRSEGYDRLADWDVFSECVDTGRDIIANGDIKTKEDVEIMKSYGCKGVMIGRAAIKDPGIIGRLKGIYVPSKKQVREEYLELCKEREFNYSKNVLKYWSKKIKKYY